MGNKSIVQSFSYGQDDVEIMEKMEEIAKREKRSLSFLLVESAKEYVKAHGEGNETYALDEFSRGDLLAYPTAWLPFDWKRIGALTDDELTDMMEKLLARTNELNEEVRRRYPGLAGFREFKRMKSGEGVPTSKPRR
jgi:hypothetical protein